jgi:general secretion pathway protein G
MGMPMRAKAVIFVVALSFVACISDRADRARVAKAHADISSFMMALSSYKLDTGEYPTTEQGLRALRKNPAGVKNWAGPYIQPEIPKDPWGHDYAYRYPGEHGSEPDIVCHGVNADIVSWEKP